MTDGWRPELRRKLFHLLSLAYLGLYLELGASSTLRVLGAWLALEGGVEVLRLRRPGLNTALLRMFRGIHRSEEERRVSGIFWTTLGCWTTLLLFGGRREATTAALLCLAFGDMAAAVVGKAWGRIPIRLWGAPKTLEGSLACLAACLAAGKLAGAEGPGLWACASAASLLELASPPPNDNFWIPVGAAFALWASA